MSTEAPRIWLKAFFGFDPENDGYLGFTRPGDQLRLIREGKKGDLVLIYGAQSESTALSDRARALGFLEIDPVPIRDKDRMSTEGAKRKLENGWQEKWTYAVPVLRAWKVEREIEVRHIAPETYLPHRARVLASQGELLSDADRQRALELPVTPINVYGLPPVGNDNALQQKIADVFRPSYGIVPIFGDRSSHYGDGIHYLYMLKAKGCVPEILKRSAKEIGQKSLVKVGFSNDPTRRCEEHNSALPPASDFKWSVHLKSKPFSNGQSAKEAEDHLKAHFDRHFESLGGEFFLGNLDEMESRFATAPNVGFNIKAAAVRQ